MLVSVERGIYGGFIAFCIKARVKATPAFHPLRYPRNLAFLRHLEFHCDVFTHACPAFLLQELLQQLFSPRTVSRPDFFDTRWRHGCHSTQCGGILHGVIL